ncbi:MAG: lipoyl(octanoyl) transferase LipB [Alphaproteobacteria bacterium]
MLLANSPSPVGWAVSPTPAPYRSAESAMAARARAIAEGQDGELVWLLEHPPLYTAGTSAKEADLLTPNRFPVFNTGRGGQFTYHGPGQRIAYVMLDLKRRKPDVRAFVFELEAWLIDALDELGVSAERREGRVGLWVAHEGREDKIAAIGIRLSKWVSFHGISLNIDPDLSHYAGIVPCGISEHGVTSLSALGIDADMRDVDRALRRHFEAHFGPTRDTAPLI